MNMATFNHRIQIPGIILRGAENFVIFDSDFEDYMYAADMGDIGDGTRMEPPNDDDHRESYRAWKSDHSKLKTILKRLLSEEVKLAMHGAIPRTSRVHKILEWLREEYGNEDLSEMQEALEDEIKELQLSDFRKFEEFVLRLQGLFSRYLAVGGTLTEAERKKHLYNACKRKLKIEVRSLRSQGSSVTFRKALQRLKSAFMELQRDEAEEVEEAKEVNNTRTQFQCFCCLSTDHGIRNCPFSRGTKPFSLFCVEHGHWSAKCSVKRSKPVSTFHCEFCGADQDSDEDSCDPEVMYQY